MAGLYVHVPFCARRCVYCDFYFVTTEQNRAPYLRTLQSEVARAGDVYGGREPVETIYFGGGTPSLLALEELASILQCLTDAFDTSAVVEVTFEVNPEDVSPAYLRGLLGLGITRLSVGVQSFFDDDLQFMNRNHDAATAETAVRDVLASGFDSFSVDLIFGGPDQPPEYWGANLERAVELGVPHLSTYGLTVERNTPLAKQVERGQVVPPSADEMADLYLMTMDYLTGRGYEHYEISSFARPGARAEHNSRYWQHRNYLGFGPSAHSFWKTGTRASRWANIRSLRRWQGLLEARHEPVEFREDLDVDDLANEYIMLRLRTDDGIDLLRLETHYGVDLYTDRLDDLAWLESEGYIEPVRNHRLKLSRTGKPLCDMVTSKLMLG